MSGARVVARGRLKVDARKAVAKLREHLLVDLHHYALELVRAAVASGADHVCVGFDADDFTVEWHGRSLPASGLMRLLDHVLSDAGDTESRRMRLLALGVNAALGLGPAFVDVYAASEGGCARVRFEPALLEAGEEAEPVADEIERPHGMQEGAVRVHLRRRLGWAVLRRAVLGGSPRELNAIAQAAGDLPIALHCNGKPWPYTTTAVVLARVPLTLPPIAGLAVRRAELLLTEPGDEAEVAFLEHGVVMARYVFAPGEGYPQQPFVGVSMPVRVVVDAAPLPTNASRSEVRADSAVFTATMEAARHAFELTVNALIATVTKVGSSAKAVRVEAGTTEEQLRDALGAMVGVAAGALTRGEALAPETARLLALPLLRDACGGPLSYADIASWGGSEVPVLRSDAPVESEISHWMRRVVWQRGRTAERALEGMALRDAAPLVTRARSGLKRREQFLAHAPGPVAVAPSSLQLSREAFHVESGPYAGLEGEVALRSSIGRGTRVRVFYEGRQLAIRNLSLTKVRLPADLAIAWDGRLRASFDFDDVEDDEVLRSAIGYGLMVAVAQARKLAEALDDLDSDEQARVRPVLRAATATVLSTAEELGVALPPEVGLSPGGALHEADVWSTTEGRFTSLAQLARDLRAHGVLLVASPSTRGVAPLDRRVVAVDRDQQRLVVRALGGDVTVVEYWRAVFRDAATMARKRGSAIDESLASLLRSQGVDVRLPMPKLAFQRGSARGCIAVARRALLARNHAGVRLTAGPHPRAYGPVAIVIDDDAVVPNETWSAALVSGANLPLADLERELLTTLVAALDGDEEAKQRLSPIPSDWRSDTEGLGPLLRRYLLSSLAALASELERTSGKPRGAASHHEDSLADLLAALSSLPMLTMLNADGEPEVVSAARVQEVHAAPGLVPYLDEVPGFETFDWRPLLLRSSHDREGVRSWVGTRLTSAAMHLEVHRAHAVSERARLVLLGRAVEALSDFGAPLRDDVDPMEVSDERGGIRVAVALPRGARAFESTVTILHERRYVCRHVVPGLTLPIVARCDVHDGAHFADDWQTLSPDGARAVGEAVVHAAAALAATLLGTQDGKHSLQDEQLALLVAYLLQADDAWRLDRRELKSTLRQTACFQTAQGGESRLPPLRRAGAVVYASRNRCPSWRAAKQRRSELDDPIAFVPHGRHGEALATILAALDLEVRDVTAAMGALQQSRSGSDREAPRLVGAPAHDTLRFDLDQLMVTVGVGEAELVAGPRSEVFLQTLDEPMGRQLELVDLPMPIRAVLRADALRSDTLERQVARQFRLGLSRVFERLTSRLDELPLFVRVNVRRALVAKLADDKTLSSNEAAAAVLSDIEGRAHSVESLVQIQEEQRGNVWFTTSSPPYPSVDYGRPVLVIGDEEANAWRKALPLRNMTKVLGKDLLAEQRRAAVPLQRFAIESEVRERCAFVVEVKLEGVRGELGALAPGAQDARGIHLAHGGRPLCVLSDGVDWPIVAVIDCDYTEPNRFFDGVRSKRSGERLVAELRAVATRMLKEKLAPPKDVLASSWVEIHEPMLSDAGDDGRVDAITLAGWFWLPRRWPVAPRVRVRAAGLLGGVVEVPLRRLFGSAHLEHQIPVEGDLMVLPEDRSADIHQALAARALSSCEQMLPTLAPGGVVDAYRWSVALVGGSADDELSAPTASGGSVSHGQILAELGERGELWWSERRGDVEGEFPDSPPAFVLLAEGSGTALVSVLLERAKPNVLRELGGGGDVVVDPESVRAPPSGAELGPASDAEPQRSQGSWLSGLVRDVREMMGSDFEVSQQADALAVALHDALVEIELGDAFGKIELVGRGRAVRVQRSGNVVVNVRHPTVVELLGKSKTPNERAVRLLAAAAAAELNRAYEQVTSAVERQALLMLLSERG